jgi:hypothetical protein
MDKTIKGIKISFLAIILTFFFACSPKIVVIKPPVNYLDAFPIEKETSLVNPLRGFFIWNGQTIVPQSEYLKESYYRLSWNKLEHGEGQYDFSSIDNYLKLLKPGQRIAFGIMVLNTSQSQPINADVPNYIVKKPGKGFFATVAAKQYFVPDWNDPYFLDRVDHLFQALGKKYNGDPRIAWVDIRIYGSWGEWHVSSVSKAYSDTTANKMNAVPGVFETKKRIIMAQVSAFTKTQLLIMTDDKEVLLYTLKLKTDIPIGMRRDSWGSLHFQNDFVPNTLATSDRNLIKERWKVAPVIVETYGGSKVFEAGLDGIVKQITDFHVSQIGDGGFGDASIWGTFTPQQKQALTNAALSAGFNLRINKINYFNNVKANTPLQISTEWVNLGSAPVYEKWIVKYALIKNTELPDASWSGYSTINLHDIMPGQPNLSQTDNFNLPAELHPGHYFLTVQIIDPNNYKLPMNLQLRHKLSDNSYIVGEVNIKK